MPIALITGGSAGLGRALAEALGRQGWTLVLDGRRPDRLEAVVAQLTPITTVAEVTGDVSDPLHRRRLVEAVNALGPLDLLVNNASELGGSPQPSLAELDEATLTRLLAVNVAAPLALIRALLPSLSPTGAVVNISSDAAVEHYPGWGGYGASKAALDHLTLTLAVESPEHRFYAVDPGDMRTQMHQDAFPGEDISDRPDPETVVPTLLGLLASGRASGRFRLTELAEQLGASTAVPALTEAAS
ncbi:SDR family oxidoreductase [Microlunatus panaciterrae]|uniref:NAD(P)-dependent dehydrogenase (Short-subunit alcohol dehydrogenase family) n=1 Tax=Microlunatus panaciterrae TaxID=400768 RepID=A0ABS2RID7_9ACTN|nr:SDR family oxidoreductase [Microlunatus panaciterrae]MBM7798763.1 NAD(P)-dependent dehydrogenase (short-subunit alcohol dehydrogenase family) [Microlunatus panaciterrae]